MSVIAVAGLLAFLYHVSLPNLNSIYDWVAIFLLIPAAIILDHYRIFLPPKGNSLVLDSAIYLASIYIYGLETALFILLFSNLIFSTYWNKTSFWKHLFNFCMYVFMIVSAYYTFILFGGEVGLFKSYHIISYITSLISFTSVNCIIVAIYFYFVSAGHAYSVFREYVKESVSTYLIILTLAITLSILIQSYPIMGPLLFTFIVVSLSLKLREYQFLYDDVINDQAYRKQILNSLPIGIITIDDVKSTVTINTFGAQLLNLDSEKVKKHIKGNKDRVNSLFWNNLSSNKFNRNIKLNYIQGDQLYTLLSSQAELIDQHGDRIGRIFYFIDITESEDLQKRIHHSEKLALLGEVSAGAAHEIRNPLTVIHGFLALMHEDFSEAKREKYHLSLLLREFDRINSIIEEMLLIAKPGVPKLSETYMEDIVEEIIPLINQSNPSQDLSFHVHLDRLPLLLDSKQMTQVIYNLVRNSSESMGKTGDIYIYSKVDIYSYQLFIKDTGSGIPEYLQNGIFDPFLTSKDSGTGLGLTIVQRIIENHQGEIKLDSSSEGGTTFVITLPLLNK
jgi:signal transduction histidine kinase